MTWAHFSTFRWISRDFQWFLASQFFPRDRFWKKSQWHERAHRERHFKPIFFGGVNKSLLVRGKNRYLCTFGTKLAPSKSRWAFIKNKEQISQNQKRYRIKNKEQILQNRKQYRLKNKEQLSQQRKQYRLKNKEQISQKGKRTYICECGSCIRIGEKSRHQQTKKHQNFINQ